MNPALLKPAGLRIAILVLAMVGYAALIPVIFRDSTDALGPGLLMFFGLAVVSGLWALVDSHRTIRTGDILLRWLLVAAGVGLLEALHFSLLGGGSPDTVGAELLFAVPIIAAVVLVPAVVGSAFGTIGQRPAVE